VYSRVLKHSGDKIHPRIHPAYAESLADARVSGLSSPEAAELFFGGASVEDVAAGGATSGGEEEAAASPPLVDWLHPAGTSGDAKGVSAVVVVDPASREGLGTLEQVRIDRTTASTPPQPPPPPPPISRSSVYLLIYPAYPCARRCCFLAARRRRGSASLLWAPARRFLA